MGDITKLFQIISKYLPIQLKKYTRSVIKKRYLISMLPMVIKKRLKTYNQKFVNNVVYLISYPKCGRTWLRVLIGKYICEHFGCPDKYALFLTKLTEHLGLTPIKITHDFSNLMRSMKYSKLPTDKSKYKGSKVIFLIRNIKDVIVSSYFHVLKRIKIYNKDISNFIKSKEYGAKKIVSFFNIWYKNRKVPDDFLLVKYEDLHSNPNKILIEVLQFLGIEKIENDIIEKSVKFASFNNMKEMEKENFFESKKLKPTDINDNETYKIRKGIIGGYSSYLDDRDLKYIDGVINKMNCPFLKNYI